MSLEVKGLVAGYGDVTVLDGVGFSVGPQRIVALLAQGQQVHVQLVQQAALLVAAHHALNPEKAGQPVATRHRFDLVQAGAWVQHHVAGGQLHLVRTIGVVDHEFAAWKRRSIR